MLDKKIFGVDVGWIVFTLLFALVYGFLVLVLGISLGSFDCSDCALVEPLETEVTDECIDVYVVHGDELVNAMVCEGGLYAGPSE